MSTLDTDKRAEGQTCPAITVRASTLAKAVLVYANNGEHGGEAKTRNPFMASGVLAQWDGKSNARPSKSCCRNQFTEVTGPNGGIYGSAEP